MDNHGINPARSLPLSAIGALTLGHKIEAIKIVRKETSLGLKEAKEMVEAYERANPNLRPELNHPDNTHNWLALGALLAFIGGIAFWIYYMLASI